MEIAVNFPGGLRADADVGDFVIKTDQSAQSGGDGSAPEPFTLFLASLATCAGVYVLSFCRQRNIPTDGIRLTQRQYAAESGRGLGRIEIDIHVPEGFPEKYHDALVRVADKCAVKRTIENAPVMETRVVVE